MTRYQIISDMEAALRKATEELEEVANFFSDKGMTRSEARVDAIIDANKAILERLDGIDSY